MICTQFAEVVVPRQAGSMSPPKHETASPDLPRSIRTELTKLHLPSQETRHVVNTTEDLEALLKFLLLRRLFLGRFNLIGQLVFRPGREILHIVGQIIGRRQRLPADGRLTAGEECT